MSLLADPPSGWPWPLGGVQAWFERLWNWVGEAAVNAVSVVWRWINDAVASLWTSITGAFSALWTSISAGLASLWSGIVSAFSNLWTSVSTAFSQLWTSVSGAVAGLWAGVTDAVADLWPSIVAGLTGLWTSINVGLTGLWSSTSAGLDNLWTNISGALTGIWIGFVEWGSALWTNMVTMFNGAVATIGGWVSEALAGVARAFGEGLTGFANWFIAGLTGLAQTLVGSLHDIMETVGPVLAPIIIGFVQKMRASFEAGSPEEELQKAVDEMVKTTQGRVIEEIKKIYESPFDPTKVASVAVTVSGMILAAQIGIHGMASAAGVEVLGTRLDVTDVVESVIDTMSLNRMVGATFMMPLEVGLLAPLRYAYNRLFTPLIPPIGDLIRFVVREVITPERFYATTPFHGLSTEWAKAYWDAHWVLPAFGNVVDAYHRGVVTGDELERFMVWHDYSPDPRPGTEKSDLEIMRGIIKTLVPRMDLRHAWELGRVTDEELVRRFEMLGYEDDAPLMAEIHMARALSDEIHRVRDEWIRDYIEGYINEETLRANLTELDIIGARQEYFVAYARKRREREHKKDLLSLYRDGYVKDLVTDEELGVRVAEILVEPESIRLFLEKAYVSKYRRPKGGVGGGGEA